MPAAQGKPMNPSPIGAQGGFTAKGWPDRKRINLNRTSAPVNRQPGGVLLLVACHPARSAFPPTRIGTRCTLLIWSHFLRKTGATPDQVWGSVFPEMLMEWPRHDPLRVPLRWAPAARPGLHLPGA